MNEQIKEIKERFEFNLRIAEATGGATGAEYKDIQYLLNLVDSLKQQVEENGMVNSLLETDLYQSREEVTRLNYIAVKQGDELIRGKELVSSLREQMAERERTIVRLRKALEESQERCAGRGVKTTMLNRQNRKMRNLLRDIRSEGVGDKFASKIDIALGE